MHLNNGCMYPIFIYNRPQAHSRPGARVTSAQQRAPVPGSPKYNERLPRAGLLYAGSEKKKLHHGNLLSLHTYFCAFVHSYPRPVSYSSSLSATSAACVILATLGIGIIDSRGTQSEVCEAQRSQIFRHGVHATDARFADRPLSRSCGAASFDVGARCTALGISDFLGGSLVPVLTISVSATHLKPVYSNHEEQL